MICDVSQATEIGVAYLRKQGYKGDIKPVGCSISSQRWTVAVNVGAWHFWPNVVYVVVDALTGDVLSSSVTSLL